MKPPLKKPIQIEKKVPMKPQPKPTILQQKVPSTIPKETFKVSAGKEFTNNIKTFPLNQIQSTNNVYELTDGKTLSKWEYNVFCDGKSAEFFVDQPEISFNFSAEDIKQGELGNCYFISALAALAHCPFILQSRIPLFKKYDKKNKSFIVTMFESGKLI